MRKKNSKSALLNSQAEKPRQDQPKAHTTRTAKTSQSPTEAIWNAGYQQGYQEGYTKGQLEENYQQRYQTEQLPLYQHRMFNSDPQLFVSVQSHYYLGYSFIEKYRYDRELQEEQHHRPRRKPRQRSRHPVALYPHTLSQTATNSWDNQKGNSSPTHHSHSKKHPFLQLDKSTIFPPLVQPNQSINETSNSIKAKDITQPHIEKKELGTLYNIFNALFYSKKKCDEAITILGKQFFQENYFKWLLHYIIEINPAIRAPEESSPLKLFEKRIEKIIFLGKLYIANSKNEIAINPSLYQGHSYISKILEIALKILQTLENKNAENISYKDLKDSENLKKKLKEYPHIPQKSFLEPIFESLSESVNSKITESVLHSLEPELVLSQPFATGSLPV